MAYNGWSNYATWRVALEVFDGMEFEEKVDSDYLKEEAEDIIFGFKDRNNLVSSYAQSFLEDVDYREIAENINEEILE